MNTKLVPAASRLLGIGRLAKAQAAALALVSFVPALQANDFPYKAAPATGEKITAEEVLVSALVELVIAADASRELSSPPGTVRAVRVSGLDPELERKLRTAAAPYLGRPVTRVLLEELRETVESVCQGSRVARYPRQAIGKGRVVIALTPVGPEGAGESARAVEGGSAAGVVPLVRTTATAGERFFFAGFDNQLSRRLGDERIYAGARWGEALNPHHSLGILFVGSPNIGLYHGASLNNGYRFSDDWRIDLGLAGSATKVEEGRRESRGKLVSVEPRLTRRFSLEGRAWHEARLGAEWRDYDVEVSQAAAARAFSLKGFMLQPGWGIYLPDRMGQTRADLDMNLSPGWRGDDTGHRDFGARDKDYLVFRAMASRVTRVGDWGDLVVRAATQLANQAVPALDHYYASGQSGVRGYDENRHHGYNAWFVSAEHQGPPLHPGHGWIIQPVVFIDAAGFPGEKSNDSIAGAGGGLRITAGADLSLKLEVARAVGHRAAQDEAGAVHFSAIRRW